MKKGKDAVVKIIPISHRDRFWVDLLSSLEVDLT